jgi:hypothetical protein
MLTTNLRLDPAIHRSLAAVFFYLEVEVDFIDPDMFRIDRKQVLAFQRLFRATLEDPEEAPPEEVPITKRDLGTLVCYVTAVQEYAARRSGRDKMDVTSDELKTLQDWLSQAQDAFPQHDDSAVPKLTMTVRVTPEFHRCLREALGYLEYRWELIDPDMFDIDGDKITELQELFHAQYDQHMASREPPEEVELTFEELWTVDYYLMAAEEFSARSTERGLLKLDDDDWKDAHKWLSRARQLFRRH